LSKVSTSELASLFTTLFL